jgi:hypothetical protein
MKMAEKGSMVGAGITQASSVMAVVRSSDALGSTAIH